MTRVRRRTAMRRASVSRVGFGYMVLLSKLGAAKVRLNKARRR